jgi:hypothetical protein
MILVGSPGEARLHRLDDARLEALQRLSSSADAQLKLRGALPATLEQLAQQDGALSPSSLRDPETGAPYGYRPLGAGRYELCAVFAAASDADTALRWRHGPGRTCFSLTPGVASSPR